MNEPRCLLFRFVSSSSEIRDDRRDRPSLGDGDLVENAVEHDSMECLQCSLLHLVSPRREKRDEWRNRASVGDGGPVAALDCQNYEKKGGNLVFFIPFG